MKKNYNKEITLLCVTCGANHAFITDEITGVITCQKCNRIYYGGYNELAELNQKRVDEEMQIFVKELKKDVRKFNIELQSQVRV
ncbi:hypothetical protein [Prevotella corporis]|uniref:hypothetical protein n=1 Tax=Prevotella corporis TaxID=28128 RepID=UPI0023662A80|nr:hypothetical protein [Prevotella corporis]